MLRQTWVQLPSALPFYTCMTCNRDLSEHLGDDRACPPNSTALLFRRLVLAHSITRFEQWQKETA